MFHSPASPDCDFEESMCNWNAKQGWVLKTRVEGFETSGKVLFPVSHNIVVCFPTYSSKGDLVIRYEKQVKDLCDYQLDVEDEPLEGFGVARVFIHCMYGVVLL